MYYSFQDICKRTVGSVGNFYRFELDAVILFSWGGQQPTNTNAYVVADAQL